MDFGNWTGFGYIDLNLTLAFGHASMDPGVPLPSLQASTGGFAPLVQFRRSRSLDTTPRGSSESSAGLRERPLSVSPGESERGAIQEGPKAPASPPKRQKVGDQMCQDWEVPEPEEESVSSAFLAGLQQSWHAASAAPAYDMNAIAPVSSLASVASRAFATDGQSLPGAGDCSGKEFPNFFMHPSMHPFVSSDVSFAAFVPDDTSSPGIMDDSGAGNSNVFLHAAYGNSLPRVRNDSGEGEMPLLLPVTGDLSSSRATGGPGEGNLSALPSATGFMHVGNQFSNAVARGLPFTAGFQLMRAPPGARGASGASADRISAGNAENSAFVSALPFATGSASRLFAFSSSDALQGASKSSPGAQSGPGAENVESAFVLPVVPDFMSCQPFPGAAGGSGDGNSAVFPSDADLGPPNPPQRPRVALGRNFCLFFCACSRFFFHGGTSCRTSGGNSGVHGAGDKFGCGERTHRAGSRRAARGAASGHPAGRTRAAF